MLSYSGDDCAVIVAEAEAARMVITIEAVLKMLLAPPLALPLLLALLSPLLLLLLVLVLLLSVQQKQN